MSWMSLNRIHHRFIFHWSILTIGIKVVTSVNRVFPWDKRPIEFAMYYKPYNLWNCLTSHQWVSLWARSSVNKYINMKIWCSCLLNICEKTIQERKGVKHWLFIKCDTVSQRALDENLKSSCLLFWSWIFIHFLRIKDLYFDRNRPVGAVWRRFVRDR